MRSPGIAPAMSTQSEQVSPSLGQLPVSGVIVGPR